MLNNKLYYIHSSQEENEPDFENGEFLEFSIEIGENSKIGVENGNFEITGIFKDGGNYYFEILPTANTGAVYGTIIVSDNKDPNCYETKTIDPIDQKNLISFALKTDPLEVSSKCCDDENLDKNGRPKSVVKKNAIIFEWGEWIYCVKIECYNQYVRAYINETGSAIDLCIDTCNDVDNVTIYICGYDKCGRLLREIPINFNIIHTDIDFDRDNQGNILECNLIPQNDCIFDCNERERDTPDPPEVDPDVPLETEGDLCEIIIDNPIIYVPYEIFSNESTRATYWRSFSYTAYTNVVDTVFYYDDDPVKNNDEEVDAYGLVYGRHFFPILKKEKEDNKINHIFSIQRKEPREGEEKILCSLDIEYKFMTEQRDEPTLEIYPDGENEDLCTSGKILFFCDENDVKNDADCGNYIKLQYNKSYRFRVEAGTATWSIFSYDMNKISCKKVKNDGKEYLMLQLINLNPLPCLEASEIVIKNSADQFCTLYFGVDEDLIKEDIYVFEWFSGSVDTENNKYYKHYPNDEDNDENRYIVATCDNLYNTTVPFILHSYYSLGIDNNEIFHTGGWSCVMKGATYKLERYDGSEWQPITNYTIDNNIEINDDWYDDLKGQIPIYVGNADGVTDVGAVRITTETIFNKTTKIESDNFIYSKCYIDFVQNVSGLIVRLYIVHPGVLKYNIYTDQIGNIHAVAG